MMKYFIATLAVTGALMQGAMAQSPTPAAPAAPMQTPTRTQPPVVPPSNPAQPGSTMSSTDVTPAVGANSFTMGQARSRMEAAGFTNIAPDMIKEETGAWRAMAQRNGQPVTVWLDYKGQVTTTAPQR